VLPLGYSSNLHAAEDIPGLLATIANFTAPARERLGWPVLGLDLRLGSRAIAELADPRQLSALRQGLDAAGAHAYTLNGFPLRPFQAAVVKRDAYLPDWRDASRLDDTMRLIPIALALSDEALVTVSTVPGTYRPLGNGPEIAIKVAENLGRWAAAAARAKRDTGRTVVLALEPEPWCLLETSWDVADFWKNPLAHAGLAAAAAALDGDTTAARTALATHLGICVDTCHLSLAFEDQSAAVERMAAAGARIAKCQVSAAPEVTLPDPDGVAALRALHEPRFCHQTACTSANGSLSKVEDLDQLDACIARLGNATTVRSHFHIPVFRTPTATGLSTTITDSLRGLKASIAAGCTHLAVETYTWSILAANERDALAGTVRELAWLQAQPEMKARA